MTRPHIKGERLRFCLGQHDFAQQRVFCSHDSAHQRVLFHRGVFDHRGNRTWTETSGFCAGQNHYNSRRGPYNLVSLGLGGTTSHQRGTPVLLFHSTWLNTSKSLLFAANTTQHVSLLFTPSKVIFPTFNPQQASQPASTIARCAPTSHDSDWLIKGAV